MRYLTYLVICTLVGVAPFHTLAQSGQVIRTPTEYFQEGVIFDSLIDNAPLPLNSVSRFKPSLEEITIAEEMINAVYNNKYIKLKDCHRQYFGYTDKQGDRVVLVQLINTKVKRRERGIIKEWKAKSMAGFGEFYEKNIRRYFVEILQKKFLWNLG